MGDSWHVNLSVGQVKIKTTATLTTHNTMFRSGDAVLKDYPKALVSAINAGERGWQGNDAGFVTNLTALAAERGVTPGSLGTYVRKLDETLTSTVITLSIGTSF